METLLTDSYEEAAAVIRRGGIVAFPTETVYGLGADVFDESAIARIFEAKMRPGDNPLIAHVAPRQQVMILARDLSPTAERLISAFFPGPLTVVVKCSDRVPSVATAGLDTVGIRMPQFELAHSFIDACGTPVVAPSANLSGRPSPTTWQAVYEDLNGRIDCILRGPSTKIGLESTVVDCTSDVPVLLRLGAISLEELREVVPETVRAQFGDEALARSPGARYKHYAPRAKVIIVDPSTPSDVFDDDKTAYIGLHSNGLDLSIERICEDVSEYAHILFEFFRECDRKGIRAIFCERVPETGIGAALMDRLRRAAEA